jgi:hypothetical protein
MERSMPGEQDIPDFVTHYFRASKAPFLNLSSLAGEEALIVMAAMVQERRDGIQHRPFGRTYLEMRLVTEDRLRQKFLDAGGRPERRIPHYFVLGESPWFAGLAVDMQSLRLPIGSLPPDQTTVTWGDSFAAMEVARHFDPAFESRPYYGQLFGLADIPALAIRYGIPHPAAEVYDGLPTGNVPEAFVEVQLWSDGPIREHLSCSRHEC